MVHKSYNCVIYYGKLNSHISITTIIKHDRPINVLCLSFNLHIFYSSCFFLFSFITTWIDVCSINVNKNVSFFFLQLSCLCKYLLNLSIHTIILYKEIYVHPWIYCNLNNASWWCIFRGLKGIKLCGKIDSVFLYPVVFVEF